MCVIFLFLQRLTGGGHIVLAADVVPNRENVLPGVFRRRLDISGKRCRTRRRHLRSPSASKPPGRRRRSTSHETSSEPSAAAAVGQGFCHHSDVRTKPAQAAAEARVDESIQAMIDPRSLI